MHILQITSFSFQFNGPVVSGGTISKYLLKGPVTVVSRTQKLAITSIKIIFSNQLLKNPYILAGIK